MRATLTWLSIVILGTFSAAVPAPAFERASGYPDATNTGVPPGTQLTIISGDINVTIAGTIIEYKDVHGCIKVNAPDVIIRKSKVSCNRGVISSFPTTRNLLVEDVTIDCQGASTAIGSHNYTARRIHAYNCDNTFWAQDNVRIEESYIHNPIPYDPKTDPHTDGIQMGDNFSNVTIRRNRIHMHVNKHDFGNAAITIGGGVSNLLIEDNILAGGGYTIHCSRGGNTDYRVVNNRFSKIFSPKVGYFGPNYNCEKNATEFSGNVIHETGALLPGQRRVAPPLR